MHVGIDDGQNWQLLSRRELFMHKVLRQKIVWPDRHRAIIAELGFYTPLWRLVLELQV